jgi:DNA processing protein
VISGLALGIDGASHEATIEQGGKAVAILGCGIDDATLYPRQHVALAHKIIERGGAVVSEFAPRTEAMNHHFPLRNRIIAGLSRVIVVVEAAVKSGSLITAHLAAEQGKEVMAVPGPITHVASAGTHMLLRNGATLYHHFNDLLELLKLQTAEPPPPAALNLTPIETAILEELSEPTQIDELARALSLPIPELSKHLLGLELKELISSTSANTFARSGSSTFKD